MPIFRAITKIFLLCCLIFTACKPEKQDVDLSKIAVNIKIRQFGQAFFAIDTNNFAEEMGSLIENHPNFSELYFQNVYRNVRADSSLFRLLDKFRRDQYIIEIGHAIDSVYPNPDQLNKAFTDAFKRFRYYFPDKAVPEVYTYPASISGFKPLVWTSDSILAVGIDCFLGADYRFYPTTGYPNYIVRRFTPQHLLPVALKGFFQYHFPFKSDDKTFLNRMVYEGKKLFFVRKLLPKVPDSVLLGYSAQNMGWAENYERDIWAYFIDNSLLYSSDELNYQQYLDEAPFTSDLGNQSAPRIGMYAGYRIVQQYMERNADVSLAELLTDEDYQGILRKSGYKPK